MIQPALSSSSTLPSIGDLLARGKQAAMMSQRDLARELLAYVVYLEPGNADGWLWLSGVVDSPEQVRYCLQRTLRIDPYNARALRGIDWLDSRQKDIDEARAAAERVKPYWQTSKPKPLLNLIKKRNESHANATATGETHTARNVPSWTSVSPTSSQPIAYTRSARSNMPTMPVSAATLEKLTGANSAPVKDPTYRDEVLAADDDLAPRFVTNVALHNLWRAIQKVTGEIGFNAMLQQSGLVELSGYFPEADETPAINYTRFSAFTEAMEEFYGSAVATMEAKVGREMFRLEIANKGKLANAKGISFKLMSADKKLQTILMELADAHARMGMESYFEERDGGYMFVVETCPYCYGRLTNAHCNVTAGYLQAGVEWATGRTVAADEVSCRGLDEHECAYWIPSV
ncbi:MAG: hypothetical protein ABIQ44_06430 [Chloroflexia bacterium]